MATVEQIHCVHSKLAILSGVGSIAALLGMSTYFMSYEYKDFDRMNLQSQDRMDEAFTNRKRNAQASMVVAAVLYISGIVVLALSMSLYEDEREQQAFTIPELLQQIRNNAAQPDINEPAILAGISSAMVVLGIVQSVREFYKHERFGWIGSSIYAAGWLGNAFAASMNNRSISSLKTQRLAWTLPGAATLVAGTFFFPWQLRHNYVSGPAWPLVAVGYVLFGVGNSLVTSAPELVTSA